ncbi:cupin domain-containing protein [Meiothermus sp.]|uniref:cupin domain-containing protein n=1 Tax=Meiothermus sp. TaxID=1955249 RepID=UPI0021DD5F8A|nr:cupin domain-containing protein [Meiothermus sp.]GIW24966.1 MAG: cupin [Meiothermus sp.]
MAATRAKTKRAAQGFTWEGVEVLAYKAEGAAPFKDVTRQVLFEDPHLAAQWRYFEVAPGGHTTLERHQHVHAVMVIRGRGACLVGDEVYTIEPHDLISVPPLTWHQFRATEREPLGFLCLVNAERDRPELPGPQDLQALRQNPRVAAFIRV